jgi:MFS transporter, PPP family, 3-phenylpropionic acid transporter
VFYGALFAALGVQLPFLPVWLAARGLDAAAIGVVLALPMVVRVFAIPFATRSADRHDALRLTIATAAGLAALCYGGLAFAHGMVAIAIVFALASVAYTPIMPLADAYALRGLHRLGRAYGPVRLWGSASFIVGSLGAGTLLDILPAGDLIWLLLAAVTATAAAALGLAPLTLHGPSRRAGPSSPARALVRDPRFLAAIAAASLIQASHAVYYGFSALAWQAGGLDGTAIGALWALAVVAEIVLFAISGRLALAPTTLLALGAAGAAARWGAMALDPPPVLLPFLQCLHALSFGATHLGAVGCVAHTAPPELAATAQGHLAVALGVVMAAAMGLAGVLYERSSGLAYGAMVLTAILGGLLAIAAARITSDKSR